MQPSDTLIDPFSWAEWFAGRTLYAIPADPPPLPGTSRWVVLEHITHDNPHVLALFRRRGHWGALSKSNGAWLRYREPVYRTLRELAMSYFHEFFDRQGRKTLRAYSRALDLRSFDPALWVTSAESCWRVHDAIASARHYPLVSAAQARALSRRDAHERRAAELVQYPRPPA